jgi:hypothetical protein
MDVVTNKTFYIFFPLNRFPLIVILTPFKGVFIEEKLHQISNTFPLIKGGQKIIYCLMVINVVVPWGTTSTRDC